MDASVPTVLVAEDHEDSREALRLLLEAFGYRVLLAQNGYQAVEQALASSPDLILMDVMMPIMDGLQATRTLRSSERFRDVPIIAVTAMNGAERLAIEAGCTGYVPKPLDIRRFIDLVRGWLDRPAPVLA